VYGGESNDFLKEVVFQVPRMGDDNAVRQDLPPPLRFCRLPRPAKR
jgi:hypothetical protein